MQYDMYGGSVSAGTQDSHLTPVESLQPTSISRKKAAMARRVAHRGSAFTKDEDNVLCSAFLNIGKDPVTGGQKGGALSRRLFPSFVDSNLQWIGKTKVGRMNMTG